MQQTYSYSVKITCSSWFQWSPSLAKAAKKTMICWWQLPNSDFCLSGKRIIHNHSQQRHGNLLLRIVVRLKYWYCLTKRCFGYLHSHNHIILYFCHLLKQQLRQLYQNHQKEIVVHPQLNLFNYIHAMKNHFKSDSSWLLTNAGWESQDLFMIRKHSLSLYKNIISVASFTKTAKKFC